MMAVMSAAACSDAHRFCQVSTVVIALGVERKQSWAQRTGTHSEGADTPDALIAVIVLGMGRKQS